MVSVVCIAFNHERYIKDAIDGFLMQETDFPIEIVIHDDASTDATQEIIRAYADQYPSLIRPVLQTVNQFSQGKACLLLAASYAKGEYVALCEGDDYWTDPLKLAIQVEEMRKHPQCDISFHSAVMRYGDRSAPDETFCRHAQENKIFTTSHIILGDGAFMPTASLCLTRKFLDDMLDPRDSFFSTFLYDYFLQVFGSLQGGALFISREMSVYRFMSSGSWTETMTTDDGYYLNWMSRNIHAIQRANFLTEDRYSKEFEVIIKRRHGAILRSQLLPLTARTEYYWERKQEIGFLNVILWNTVYRHGRINRMLANRLPLLRKVRSALSSCHFAG